MFKQILSAAACLGLLFAAAPAKAEGQKPESLSSLSAVLYEPESGRVLYEKDAIRPPAHGQYHQADDGAAGYGERGP